ncbi:hypothetical protein N481_26085 [Pseudoalteromonas luteoviolacea S4047-1]|uniref:Uncharacterized protein n=1 Tax=Pseudoalteromonas luteoviolacea S4054 TaxID=1129367 RepID=A0A0F6AHN6_9GAMM|nr:hypothetical protein N479_25250 [Pseudoalteromonas luteoviolacea S4054]KZN78421.1 hypothetical protein N481_26085 [Pseudoalteromonas luteoviolacea S4047-1]
MATKLQKTYRDKGKSWYECESFKHIQTLVHEKFG